MCEANGSILSARCCKDGSGLVIVRLFCWSSQRISSETGLLVTDTIYTDLGTDHLHTFIFSSRNETYQ